MLQNTGDKLRSMKSYEVRDFGDYLVRKIAYAGDNGDFYVFEIYQKTTWGNRNQYTTLNKIEGLHNLEHTAAVVNEG